MNQLKFCKLVLLVVILSLFACDGEKKKSDLTDGDSDRISNSAATKRPEIGSMTGDTLNIGGKFVLFFGPDELVDSIRKTTAADLQALKSSSKILIDSIAAVPEITAVYSTAPVFRIMTSNGSVMVITKKALNEETGLLMTDGNQPPTIKKGILTTEAYHELIKKYFFLK